MIATTEEPEEGGKPNPFSMHMHQLSNKLKILGKCDE